MFNLIPLPYRILAAVLAFVLWSGFMIAGGWKECSIREQAKQKDQALAYAEAIKAEQARGNVIVANLETEKSRQKIVYRTITQEVPKYVSSLSDAHCTVPAGFVELHNAAAEARLPTTTSQPPDAPSGVALSAVADTVTDNYATCNEWRGQLNALIDFEVGRKP